MVESEKISIEVVYALPEKQTIIALQVNKETTIQSAIEQSGVLHQYPQIDLDKSKVGIFGKARTMDSKVCNGDRIELYRPLIADPKEARKRRAEHKKQNQ